MNERIRELFKQTALHRNDHTTEQRLYEVEKFAELIVQECCRALNPMLRDMISRGQGVDMIKQQFVVDK